MVDPVAAQDHAPGSTEHEAALLASLARGDARALESIYDLHGTRVYSLALAITRNPSTAEDAVAVAFRRFWQEVRTGHTTGGSLFTRISEMVRREALRHRGDGVPTLRADHAHRGGFPGMTQALTPRQQRIVELAYFGGLERGAIAREIGETELTVALELRTAMRALREALPVTSTPVPRRRVSV